MISYQTIVTLTRVVCAFVSWLESLYDLTSTIYDKLIFVSQWRGSATELLLSNIFRFTDDLCFFNSDEFENNCKNIYPNELEFKKESEDPWCISSFLNHLMEVHDRKFTAKLFDQRNTLPIYINHMPYLDRNIPSKIFYTSIGSEILNIVRITTVLVNMVTLVNRLLI